MFEDLQSSRTKFDREHCEGDLCWSRSESEGRIERAECHLHTLYRRWFREQEEMRGEEWCERSGVHDEELWTKDRAMSLSPSPPTNYS